jgi:hypothetical protein
MCNSFGTSKLKIVILNLNLIMLFQSLLYRWQPLNLNLIAQFCKGIIETVDKHKSERDSIFYRLIKNRLLMWSLI